MKAMISQPMHGKSEKEITEARERATEYLTKNGLEVVNTLFTDEWYSDEVMTARGVVQKPLCFLAKSLENMCQCEAVFFCKGWENARGCRIEHEAATKYGLIIIHEEDVMRADGSAVPYEVRKQVYETALDRWGIKPQLLMVLEEMSELQKEICKCFRGANNLEAIAEETADVTIMLEQLQLIFGNNRDVCEEMDKKVKRLAERLGMTIHGDEDKTDAEE